MKILSFDSNTTGVTCGAGSTNPSGTPVFTLGFSGIHIARSLVFYVVLCRRLFVQTNVLFLLAIMFSVLRFTASDYPFDINKLY